MSSDDKGFSEKHKDATMKGGQTQSKSTSTNPSNFSQDRQKASQAGKKGGETSTSTS
jgi:general stress protein YciG